MDFRNRGASTPTSSGNSAPNSFSSQSNNGHSSTNLAGSGVSKWLQRSSVILLFCVTVIIAAVAVFAAIGGSNQASAIKKDKYQAVFLNNGQVYFGHIKDLNNKFVNLQNIYYLQTNNTSSTDQSAATSSPTNVTLVKLGCELHGPYDQMIINDSQVLFWENLQDNSQVVQKIKQLPSCTPSNGSSSTQQAPNSSSSTQPTTSTGTGSSSNSSSSTTPSPSSSTKKP